MPLFFARQPHFWSLFLHHVDAFFANTTTYCGLHQKTLLLLIIQNMTFWLTKLC